MTTPFTAAHPAVRRFGWIRRRARRIQKFYRVPRKLAVHDAWLDWISFSGALT